MMPSLPQLNFPAFQFQIESRGQKKFIFDIVRKKFIPLTPEEWVRQHAVHYLVLQKNYPKECIAVERELSFNRRRKRFDLMVFSGSRPVCLIECKAPHVEITTETVLQAAVYNQTFNCRWLWMTNGLKHVWLELDNGKIKPAEEPASF